MEQALREDGLSEPAFASKRQALVRLRDVLFEPYFGWQEWIMLEGPMDLDRFNRAIQDWLDAPVDHTQSEFIPIDYGSQGGPYRFFSMMDPDVRDELGVVVVEGEHPGSTYYAAELRKPVDEARRMVVAQALDYAVSIFTMNYASFEKAVLGGQFDGEPPRTLCDAVSDGEKLREDAFHDAVVGTLRKGRAIVLMVGVGISLLRWRLQLPPRYAAFLTYTVTNFRP